MEAYISKKAKTEEEKVKLTKAMITAFLDLEKALDCDKEYEAKNFEQFKTNNSDCYQIIKTYLKEDNIQFHEWDRMLDTVTDRANDKLIIERSLEIMKNRDSLEKQKKYEESINLKKQVKQTTDEMDERMEKMKSKENLKQHVL